MKVIIAGSRDINRPMLIEVAVDESGFDITEVVSGGARGIDALGEEWAKTNNIPVKRFLADWNQYGKRAGPIRNGQMADYADALIAIHNGSPGTLNMIQQAKTKGLEVYVMEMAR